MQTIVAYVQNKPGVLNRVASLTRRLAINIDSLTVGPTENVEIARMTICAHTDERGATRLEASLEKLVDVLLADNISDRPMLERDLALIKVAADQQNRPHLMELIKVFRGRVVDVAPESLIVEVSGTVDKIDGLLEVLRPFGVLEMARTGRIAMTRGNDLLRPPEEAGEKAAESKAPAEP
jgi:acetolactate synthase-1/3 small subunit